MSADLLEFAKQFAETKMSAELFADEYVRRWKQERDDRTLLRDAPSLSETLSSIFCLADLFDPGPDRREYALDEEAWRTRVRSMLSK